MKGDWVNVYDPLDLIPRLDRVRANYFKKNGKQAGIDIQESNWGAWRHSATKYFKGQKLRKELRRLAGREE